MKSKISLDDLPASSFPAYKPNKELFTRTIKKQSNQKLIKFARRLAGIPINGISEKNKHKYSKIEGRVVIFLPQKYLERSGNLNEFYKIVKKLCSEFPKDLHGNSHFERAVRCYIYYNKIMLIPSLNVMIGQTINFEEGWFSTLTPLTYGYQYEIDKQWANETIKEMSDSYPDIYKRPLRGKRTTIDYERIIKWDKQIKREKYIDVDGVKKTLGTYKNLAKENVGIENADKEDIVKKEHQRIRQIKSRMKKHLSN